MARTTVNLQAWRDERRAAASVPIELGDGGEPVRVDPLDLWPEDWAAAGVLDHVLTGDDAANRYRAAGGNVATLIRIVRADGDLGESEDSSAS